MPNCCIMHKEVAESVYHLFLYCKMVHELWVLYFALFGVRWIMPSSALQLVETRWVRSYNKNSLSISRMVPPCKFLEYLEK